MKAKSLIRIVLVALFLLAMNSKSAAVNTSGIDAVRNKSVLNDQDKEVIDEFLAEAIRELIINRDFTSTAMTRTVILSRYSNQGLYGNWYSELIHKHIRAGFEQALNTESEKRKNIVLANLLILLDGLQDMQLSDLAISMLKSPNQIVRYWAVHCLSNPGVVKLLNSDSSNSTLARNIIEQLKETVGDSSPEILVLIARFAAQMNLLEAEELIIQVADERIKRYADWTVKHELSDIAILIALENKIQSSTTGRAAIARRFAHLYSYAIQRYVKGSNILNDVQKRHLISVMVEIEEQCISKLLNGPQQSIRRALERENTAAVMDEHNRLLGDGSSAGRLPSTLRFDYGTASDGTKRAAPEQLPDPPQKPTPDN